MRDLYLFVDHRPDPLCELCELWGSPFFWTFGTAFGMLPDMSLGSLDFFFDQADQLEKLGTEFCLIVKHPQDKSVVILCNVTDRELGVAMNGALVRWLRAGFPDAETDEDPNPDSDLAD